MKAVLPLTVLCAALAVAGCGDDADTGPASTMTSSPTSTTTTGATPSSLPAVPPGSGPGSAASAAPVAPVAPPGDGASGAPVPPSGGDFSGRGPSSTTKGGNLVTPPSVGGIPGLPSQNPGD